MTEENDDCDPGCSHAGGVGPCDDCSVGTNLRERARALLPTLSPDMRLAHLRIARGGTFRDERKPTREALRRRGLFETDSADMTPLGRAVAEILAVLEEEARRG